MTRRRSEEARPGLLRVLLEVEAAEQGRIVLVSGEAAAAARDAARHRGDVLRKLDVPTRGQAAVRAQALGIA